MILGLFQDTESESTAEGGPIGWAYMGSHNFTASAWGRISGRDALDAAMDVRIQALVCFNSSKLIDARRRLSITRLGLCFRYSPRLS